MLSQASSRVFRTVVNSCRLRSPLVLLVLCTVLATAAGCVGPYAALTPTPALVFDLSHPPKGWHRTVDPLSGEVLWLPPDWEMITTPDWADYPRETGYRRLGGEGLLHVDVIAWVDFAKNPRDPANGRYPISTYSMTIDDVVIPCARYEYQIGPYPGPVPSAKHVCIVYTWRPDVVWELSFYVAMKEEDALMPLWRPIVTSFVREEQPTAVY